MKDFICKKCGNTTYIMQEKLNGTGKAIGLYCAKCGTWHKWLNRQEKVLYTTVDSDKDKEIARLTAENAALQKRLDNANDEIKAEEKEIIQKIYEAIKLVDCLQYNPSVDFNYLRAKGVYNIIKNQVEHIEAENEQLKKTLSKLETVEKELRARLENAVELPCIEPMTTWDWDDTTGLGKSNFGKYWQILYRDENGEFIAYIGATKAEAEARLAELKGEKK